MTTSCKYDNVTIARNCQWIIGDAPLLVDMSCRPLRQHALTRPRSSNTNYGTAAILGWMVDEKHNRAECRYGTRHNATTKRHPAATSIAPSAPANTTARGATCCAANGAYSETSAYSRHQGWHHHVSGQPIRLCDLPAEGALLSEHADV
jgi:hypothetical protein